MGKRFRVFIELGTIVLVFFLTCGVVEFSMASYRYVVNVNLKHVEANARIIIDRLLRESDWVLSGDGGIVNADMETQNQAGFADYVLKDTSDFPLCIIEAKKELVSPLAGKEQAGVTQSL